MSKPIFTEHPSRTQALAAAGMESSSLVQLAGDVNADIQPAIAACLRGERSIIACSNRRRLHLLKGLVTGAAGDEQLLPLLAAASRNQWLSFLASKQLSVIAEWRVLDALAMSTAQAMDDERISAAGLDIVALRDDELGEFFVEEFLFELAPSGLAERAASPSTFMVRRYDDVLPSWLAPELTSTQAGSTPGHADVHFIGLVAPHQYADLALTLQSLAAQTVSGLRVSLVGFEPEPAGLPSDVPFNWRELNEDDDCMVVLNEIAASATAEWLVRLHPGHVYAPAALASLLENRGAQAQCLYANVALLGEDGSIAQPLFRPSYSLMELHHGDCFDGFLAIRHAAFMALGGYRPTLHGAEEYDLLLRLHEHGGAAAFERIDALLCYRAGPTHHAYFEAVIVDAQHDAALNQHLARHMSMPVTARRAPWGGYALDYAADTRPVAVLAVCRDQYNAYASLIANTGHESIRWELQALAADRSAWDAWIESAATCSEEWLLLLDMHDGAPDQRDWVGRMQALAELYGAGLVSPAMHTDDALVDCGWVLGMHNQAAAPLLLGHGVDIPTMLGMNVRPRVVSAVSPRCMLIRRQLFNAWASQTTQVGPASLGLYLQAHGVDMVWNASTPLRQLRLAPQTDDLQPVRPQETLEGVVAVSGEATLTDPHFSSYLSLESPILAIEQREFAIGTTGQRDKPRLLGVASNEDGASLRVADAMSRLWQHGAADTWLDDGKSLWEVTFAKAALDGVVLAYGACDLGRLRHASRLKSLPIVGDFDIGSIVAAGLTEAHLAGWLDHVAGDIANLDRLVLTSPGLAERLSGAVAEIRVVPVSLSEEGWQRYTPQRRDGIRPRVGWFHLANSASLHEDVLPVIQALARVVDWVWVGDCPTRFRPYMAEVHPSPRSAARPVLLASLDLDLAVCRLPFDTLGEWMDALPLLELGSLGYPIICSDAAAFRVDLPVQRIGNSAQDWAEAIHAAVQDRTLLAQQGALLRESVTAAISAAQVQLLQAYLP
jgi:hypothetical protein